MNYFFSNLKYKILGIVFVVALIISYIVTDKETLVPSRTDMKAATLPIVMMQTEDGVFFNELHGYTSEVDAHLINETVTPLQDDRRLKLVINTYGETVTGISYSIRNSKDMSLIEDTKVSDYSQSDNTIQATFRVKNLIENDMEYLMEIKISTEEHEKVSYYTKTFISQNLNLKDKLQFVKEFNEWTFDKDKLDNIKPYIETKSSGDNSNYGKVNINSSKTQIGWGDLNPFVEQDIIPTIKELNGEVASIVLGYNMAVPDGDKGFDKFIVDEFYRIRQSGEKMYLLNFEREANQIFDSRNDLMESSRINLGISSSESAKVINSEGGQYTCFVRQGNLWCFNDDGNVFTNIFSFEDQASDGIRENYNQHDIKVMDVSKDGNIYFIVYGYMNRGEHEGEIGVSLCQYTSKDNNVNELIYIPVTVPYEVLSQNIGEVAYIGANGAFYILLDDSLYSIDLTSKEKMTEISGLTDETYAVSEDGTAIAYSLNGKLYDTSTIRIFNMATGSDYHITCDETDRLRVLGYVKNDLAYGLVHLDDVVRYDHGGVMFPMYCVEIMDSFNQVIKKYEVDGVYVSDAVVSGMRLTMNRVERNEDGDYVAIDIDQLLNKDENVKDSGAYVEVVTSQSRKKELYIDLQNKVSNAKNVSMKASSSVQFSEGEILHVDARFSESGKYYVYGYGRFQGSFTSLVRAIEAANDTYGTVYDSNAQAVWKRYRQTEANVGGIEGYLKPSDNSLAGSIDILMAMCGADVDSEKHINEGENALSIIEKNAGVKALNLQGASLSMVLYYVNVGIPVVGKYGANEYVVVTGYDSKKVSYYDTARGKMMTTDITTAEKNFEQYGKLFVTYMR